MAIYKHNSNTIEYIDNGITAFFNIIYLETHFINNTNTNNFITINNFRYTITCIYEIFRNPLNNIITTHKYTYTLHTSDIILGQMLIYCDQDNYTIHTTRSGNGIKTDIAHVNWIGINEEYRDYYFGKFFFIFCLAYIYRIYNNKFTVIQLDDVTDLKNGTRFGFYDKMGFSPDTAELYKLDKTSKNTHINYNHRIQEPNKSILSYFFFIANIINMEKKLNKVGIKRGGNYRKHIIRKPTKRRNKKTIRNQKKSSQGTLKNRNRAK
jgi:hypothetical protein